MSDDIVHFTRKFAAKSEPTFVIEKDGRLYVTAGVLEYDPDAADLSEEQKRGVRQMRELFDTGRAKQTLQAVEFGARMSRVAPVQTGPAPGPIRNPRGGG